MWTIQFDKIQIGSQYTRVVTIMFLTKCALTVVLFANMVRDILDGMEKIDVTSPSNMTVDFCFVNM